MFKTLSLSARAETTALKQPKEVLTYSRTTDGTWNTSDLRDSASYYYFPDSYVDRNYDLSTGFKNFRSIPEEQNLAHFPSLLEAIQKHEQQTGLRVKADIVTFRGIMTDILTLPLNQNKLLNFYVIAFDGQLFIKHDDEIELSRRKQEDSASAADPEKHRHQKICQYSGYKFESLVTLPAPWANCKRSTIESRHKKTVSNYEQYISVVRTGIGKVKTLLAGEVDCVWNYLPENGGLTLHYVELKTSRVVENANQALRFELKLFRTWAQCFLLGIKHVVYGFRDDKYILKDVEHFNTEEIPVLLKENSVPRKGQSNIVCVDALKWYGAVLDWLVKNVDAKDESKAYKLVFDSSLRTFTLNELMGGENKALRGGELLTPEFISWRRLLAQ